MQKKIEKFNNFMAKLESAVATDAEREAVRASAAAFKVLAEATITDTTSMMRTNINTFGKHGTAPKPSTSPIADRITREMAKSEAPSMQDVNAANLVMQAWAQTADAASVKRWIDRMQAIVDARVQQQYGMFDDPKKAFQDELSGKADADRAAVADEMAKKEAAKKAAEEKAAAEKQKHIDAVNDINDKERSYDSANLAHRGSNLKLGLKDRLARWYHKKRAGIVDAVKANDLALVESIEAEIRSAKAFMEAMGIDVSAIIY